MVVVPCAGSECQAGLAVRLFPLQVGRLALSTSRTSGTRSWGAEATLALFCELRSYSLSNLLLSAKMVGPGLYL